MQLKKPLTAVEELKRELELQRFHVVCVAKLYVDERQKRLSFGRSARSVERLKELTAAVDALRGVERILERMCE